MKTLKFIAAASAVLLSQLTPSASWAADGPDDKHHDKKPATAKAADTADMSDGEVRKIDKDTKKITLKHGELKNLGMPAMTMVFQVKDTALLDKVKAGDQVKFKAEKVGSGYAVTEIDVAK